MKLSNKIFLTIFFATVVALPRFVFAQETFPKIANYYLNYFTARDYNKLARYDLLVLQPEMAINQPKFFAQYRQLQPDGKLFAYLYPASFYRSSLFYDYFGIRQGLFKQIDCQDLWLRDSEGDVVTPWPQMSAVNLTSKNWRDLNLNYLIKSYRIKKSWDGIFWDLVDSEPSRYTTKQINIKNNNFCAPDDTVNANWQTAMADFLAEARKKISQQDMVINGNSLTLWQPNINGRMFEHFPTPWEGDGSWTATMKQYLNILPKQNVKPNIYIINARYDKTLPEDYYQQMRFGLASTLLGDGYYSFDSGASSHSQMWWFDEYDVDLGRPVSNAVNTTGFTSNASAGLWIREFEHGLVAVNSTDQKQVVKLTSGKYKRIKGVQEPIVNNGLPLDWLVLKPKDGVVLIKR